MKKLTVIAALAIAMLSPAVSFGMGTYYGKCDVNASEGGGVFVTKTESRVPEDDEYIASDFSTYDGWAAGSSKSLTFYAYAKANADYYFDGWYSDSGYQTRVSTTASKYEVTVKATSDDSKSPTTKTLYAKFVSMAQAVVDDITLDPSSVDYDGTTKSPTITVKAGSLTLGSDDYDIVEGSVFAAVGSGISNCTYTVTVRGKGNFSGEKSATWTVKAAGTSYAFGAVTKGCDCGDLSGTTLAITKSTGLVYEGNDTWSASLTVAVPNSTWNFVPDKALYFIRNDYRFLANDGTALSANGITLSTSAVTLADYNYVKSFTWTERFTLAEVQAAFSGEGRIVRELRAFSPPWENSAGTYSNDGGLREVTYTMTMDVTADYPVLNDGQGIRVYPPHQHDWSVQSSREALIAVECSEPGCPQEALMLSLVADSRTYNGTTYSATLKDADDFRVHVGAEVGEITYWAGETQLKSAPKYTGEYEARVAATVLGEPYVLTQQFSIYKPIDGYTDGWELAKQGVEESMWVRYDTYAEASAAANDGDTVIYHGDTINQKTYDFTSDADITVSFLGTRLRHDADGNSIFRNDGSGTVTLVNARVLQPKNLYGQDVEIVGKAGKGGAFVFGDGVDFVHQTTGVAGLYEMTLKVSNIDLEIVGGTYQIKGFSLGDGGSVSVKGGKFWSDFNPSAYVAPGYGVKEISGDFKYEVVETAEVIKEYVVDVTGGEPSEVATWLSEKVLDWTAVMGCEYLKASFELDVDLITDATTVDITDFSVSGGFSFTITLNKNATPVVIRAAAAKLASRIRVADALDLDFAAIDAARLTVNAETGRVTVLPKLGAVSEFLKILIEKDNVN